MRFIPLAVILLLVIVGFISKKRDISGVQKRIAETGAYRNDLVDLVNKFTSTKNIDNELYHSLTLRVKKMQRELGTDGIIAEMADPIRGIRIRNYQMLVNFLPELNNCSDMWDILGQQNTIVAQRFMSLATTCSDAFIRHIGGLEDILDADKKNLYNPLACLAEGIKLILWIPAYILISCGLFTGKTFARWRTKRISSIISAIITVIGIASAIITIVIGWEQFSTMVASLFTK